MRIMDIKRFAVHDGDGIRTTVFFQGCPLRCVWCHNPEGLEFKPQLAYFEHKCVSCGFCTKLCDANYIKDNKHIFDRAKCIMCGKCEEVCPQEAFKIYGSENTAEEIMKLVLEDKEFYEASGGGLTISGGECLMQYQESRELLALAKANGINTAVDTSGAVPWTNIEAVMEYTDIFLYDLKAYDEDVHKKCTGVGNKQILENLQKIDKLGAKIEIRIPYVPTLNDGEMEKLAEFISTLKNVTKVRLLPYHNYTDTKYHSLAMDKTVVDIPIPTKEQMSAAKSIFDNKGIKATVE